MDYGIYNNQPDESPVRSPLSVAKPLIGMAICVCLFVVSIMLAISLCGGLNSGGGNSAMSAFVFFLLVGSVLGFIGCLLWLVIVLILNASRN